MVTSLISIEFTIVHNVSWSGTESYGSTIKLVASGLLWFFKDFAIHPFEVKVDPVIFEDDEYTQIAPHIRQNRYFQLSFLKYTICYCQMSINNTYGSTTTFSNIINEFTIYNSQITMSINGSSLIWWFTIN